MVQFVWQQMIEDAVIMITGEKIRWLNGRVADRLSEDVGSIPALIL